MTRKPLFGVCSIVGKHIITRRLHRSCRAKCCGQLRAVAVCIFLHARIAPTISIMLLAGSNTSGLETENSAWMSENRAVMLLTARKVEKDYPESEAIHANILQRSSTNCESPPQPQLKQKQAQLPLEGELTFPA